MRYVFFALCPVSSVIDLKFNKDSANIHRLISFIDLHNRSANIYYGHFDFIIDKNYDLLDFLLFSHGRIY